MTARDGTSLDLALRLTLLLLLTHPESVWYVKTPTAILAVAGLLLDRVRHSPWFWFAITAFLGGGVAWNWVFVDNHKYLIAYWSLAIACCLLLDGREEALAKNARLLIGLSFAAATLWKVTSGDFIDGRFFRYALLFDPRFTPLTSLFGQTREMMAFNTAASRALTAAGGELTSVQLLESARLPFIAAAITAWTVVIEGLIAAAFLLPGRGLLARSRHWLLLLFAVTTYAVANVIGFAWVLMAMGVAQCDADARRSRNAYVIAFLVAELYSLPWKSVLDS